MGKQTGLQKMLVLSSEIESNQYTKHHYLEGHVLTNIEQSETFHKGFGYTWFVITKRKTPSCSSHYFISFSLSSLAAEDSKCIFYTWIFKHLPGISLQMFHRQHTKHVYRYTNYPSLWTCLYALYLVKCSTF